VPTARSADAPLRILLVTPSVGRDGGVETHVYASAQALAQAGHAVHLATATIDGRPPPGIAAVLVPGLGDTRPGPESARTLAAACAERDVDVVHLHNVAPEPYVAALRPSAAVVASAHGYSCCTPNTYYFSPGQECHRPHGPGCVPNMLLRGCAHTKDPRGIPARYRDTSRRRRGLRMADGVVGYSTAMVRHLERNRLPNIHHVRLFSEAPLDPSPLPTAPRLLFVGRVVAAKGLDVLLRAMTAVDAELDVHGDGWWLPEGRKLAQRLGLAGRVRFHGWSSPDALSAAYRHARAVVVPSLWPEPFGLVGLEAMSYGRPVVGSATGGIVDWLRDGETGLAVRPGDHEALAVALAAILRPDGTAERMAQAGVELVAGHFSPEDHVEDLRAVYAHALDRRVSDRRQAATP
jgi:glycosyltransferase involved in cell wall biosynthesis